METFNEEFQTKLSSAGLIYKHFGKDVIAHELHWHHHDPKIDIVYLKLYKEFIEALDANDNGISAYPQGIVPKFVDKTTLAQRVARLNPHWNEPPESHDLETRFGKAMEMAGQEFLDRLHFVAHGWLPARELVQKAMETRSILPTEAKGRVIRMDKACPWKDHLFELENEMGIAVDTHGILYVVFPDDTSQWRVQAVPDAPDSFKCRKALPEPWRGLRDAELDAVTGVDAGAVFVHHSGFIGGHRTYNGALAMAIKALSL